MNKKILFINIIVFALVFLLLCTVSAHQPRIVSGELTVIENPEVSQAFYGNLKGEHVYYEIRSDNEFDLYVSILVPDIKDIGKDVSVEVFLVNSEKDYQKYTENEKEPLIFLNASEHNWTHYYEEFAGDDYFKGPEEKIRAEKGTYLIKVQSPDNEGKYVLVVGEKEEFPLNEIVKTIFTLPGLKKNFFEKSPLTAYFNLIGVFMLVLVLIIFVVSGLVYTIMKKIIIKNKN